jgi:hypothetical protein
MVTYFILGLADLCFLGSLKFTVNKVSLASSKIKLSAVVILPRIALAKNREFAERLVKLSGVDG